MATQTGILYLFPTTMGDSPLEKVLPQFNIDLISTIRHFIVEDVRTARRFLKKCNREMNIDELTFSELNQHTNANTIGTFLDPLLKGCNMGVLSEAGCPAIADPGADVVAIAQSKGVKVVPLVGPSSILMALMGSGFNGQSFAFNGYLPIQQSDRIKALKRFEQRAKAENQSQLFIETPYRNIKLLQLIIEQLHPDTLLCIAVDISLESEEIYSKTVKEWRKTQIHLEKRPAIFIIYK